MHKNKKMILFGVVLVLVLSLATTFLKMRRSGVSFMNEYDESFMGMPSRDGGGAVVESMPMVDGFSNSKVAIQAEPMMGGTSMPYYYQDDLGLDVENRLYDRSANYSVIVDDVQGYMRSMREYILSVDGVVLNDNFSQGSRWNSGNLFAKVPVEKFSEASTRVTENVKEIFNSSSNSSDVTGSHVRASDRVSETEVMLAETQADLEVAQTNLEKAESGSVQWRQFRTEVIQLENRVKMYESQLKQYRASVDSIETQVEYATISISASDSKRYFDPNSELSIREHLTRALESLGYHGYFLITFLI